MLSDEEKKAIEYFKSNLEITKEMGKKWGFQEEIKNNEIILNLIEKQSKEIEELKEKNKELCNPKDLIFSYYDTKKGIKVALRGFISIDKIKAKKEEINKKYKAIESNYTEQAIDAGDIEADDYVEMQSIQYADDILQSLL